MSILATAAQMEEIGGQRRKLLITNREIERFEMQHGGIFDFWDQLFGHQPGLKAVHVRDLVALALVGGGMADAAAESAIAAMGPDHNPRLRQIAQRALGLAYFPEALVADVKKNYPDGSAEGQPETADQAADTTPENGYATSAV